MPQAGYYECSCCGRMYKTDGTEYELFAEDHMDIVLEIKQETEEVIEAISKTDIPDELLRMRAKKVLKRAEKVEREL